ncbi:Eukaryotic translation initiation factor 3 subunit B [Glycine soja]|nr:Eukaryotic translation initiation factor 3 subunit B [Glycine soja]
MLATIMADVMVMKEIEDTALHLDVDLSILDLDAIRLPPDEDCGIVSDDEVVYQEENLEFESGFGNIIVVEENLEFESGLPGGES